MKKDNNLNNNNNNKNIPSQDWQSSSRWFEERQKRITTNAYLPSENNKYERTRQENRQNINKEIEFSDRKPVSKENTNRNKMTADKKQVKLSARKEKKREKEIKKLNKYIRKNKKSGKSNDELRREHAQYIRKKRRRNVVAASAFVILTVLAVLVVASLTAFFKIETINVSGQTRYSREEIITNAQVEIGDNLWRTTSAKLTENLSTTLPYIKEVKVERKIPSDITLVVTEANAKYSIKTSDGYILLDENNKVLELNGKKGDTIVLNGVGLTEPVAGLTAVMENKETYELAMEIISHADSNELPLKGVDVSNTNMITALYDNKVRLELGSGTEIETKIKMAKEIITKLTEENNLQEGVINLKSTNKAFYSEEPLNPKTTEATKVQKDNAGKKQVEKSPIKQNG